MFLVAFPHLGVIIEPSWKVAAFIDSAINTPFAIIQNFGALGVCVFFVISGFLLYSNTDTPLKFVGKKWQVSFFAFGFIWPVSSL